MGDSLNEGAKKFTLKNNQFIWFFDKNGKGVDTEELAVAKLLETENDKGNEVLYYVRKGRGNLYDPYGPYEITKTTRYLYEFDRVDKEVFDLYIKYLKQKKTKFYTDARREYLNRSNR
jgi:hypothetical protein